MNNQKADDDYILIVNVNTFSINFIFAFAQCQKL